MTTQFQRYNPSSQTPSSTAQLPALLCLHGSGSNSTVFKIQTRRLLWNLGTQFRFVFVEAPFPGDPGFGMLPVFESCAPFFRWVTHKWVAGESDREIMPRREVEVVDGLLREVMEANGGVDGFVGVMGFSQGSRVAAGLLLRQQMAKREGRECWTKFRFGVLVGGPAPPIALLENGQEMDVERDFELLREVPTVHAWGRDDKFKPGVVEMAEIFEGDVSFRFEFDGGHHFPLVDGDANDLCDYIRVAWKAAGGTEEKAAN